MRTAIRTSPPQVTDWRWINQPWTGDSSPYKRVAHRIDAEFVNKKRIEAITEQYRLAAQEKPLDPVAQYAWGYAAYLGRPIGTSIRGNEVADIALALAEPPFPRTYEYARMRFIITSRWRPYIQLKPLGNRLLKRNPNDLDVKRRMIDLLVVGSNTEQNQSLIYAQQLVRAYPKEANSYSAVAWAYDIMFAKHKDVATGDKAVAAYRKALSLSSREATRRNIERHIQMIQQEQAQLRAKR